MVHRFILLLSILTWFVSASAQTGASEQTSSTGSGATEVKPHPVSFAVALNTNYAPDNGGFSFTPLATVEWRKILLKLRYNYETANTFYASAGYNFENDSSLVWWSIRPYIGTSFGKVKNISPELAFDIGYGIFGFSADVEYTTLLQSREENTQRAEEAKTSELYTWAELYVEPTDWMYTGITAQRNAFFETNRPLDAGVIVGFQPGSFDLSLQASSFWDSDRYFVLGIAYYFQTSQAKKYKNNL